MTLPHGSIDCFEQFAKKFLSKFAGVKPPEATCESLFQIKQKFGESTRKYVNRFVAATRLVNGYTEEIAVTAIRMGLKQGGPGSLRFDSHRHNHKTLQDFVSFAEGYIRGEEDAADNQVQMPHTSYTQRQKLEPSNT
jgi:hypothetical protein